MTDETPFVVTHDLTIDAAYIYIAGAIPAGGAHRTERVGRHINLDFDVDGRLLGIEILGASKLLHPRTLAVSVPLV